MLMRTRVVGDFSCFSAELPGPADVLQPRLTQAVPKARGGGDEPKTSPQFVGPATWIESRAGIS